MRESGSLNPDCFVDFRLLSKEYFNMLLHMIRSKNLLQIGRRETRQ